MTDKKELEKKLKALYADYLILKAEIDLVATKLEVQHGYTVMDFSKMLATKP